MGPKPDQPAFFNELPELASPFEEIEDSIRNYESQHNALECAYTEVFWSDSLRRTEYSFLYLHGFSATKHEGDSFRYILPKEYEMNAVFNRMAGHGLQENDADRMSTFTAESAWNKALYDFALAKRLGKKVVLGSCSTGSLLALRLARLYPEDVAAVLNYSPNMGLPDPNSALLNDPWGLQLTKLVYGTEYRIVPERTDGIRIVCKPMAYSWESVVQMQHLVETAISEQELNEIQVPVLNMVWYEDEEHQDYVIDVAKAKAMHEALGGPKKWVSTAAKEHVIVNHQLSKDLETVYAETYSFLDRILR
ncbi:MAG: alpha/beta hydrolase [Bacteroidetes bacterium]|nr:MAG: alpha/beta hydrolase [Bacteroidota bacterium]